jgi:hypothetical protein
VIQLKSRSTGATWSLTEVVQQVLPDLYRSADLSADDVSYDFITEAEMGDWAPAYEFFRSLKARALKSDVLAGLDDEKRVRFSRGWEPATEKEFFENIIVGLRAANETVSAEAIDETRGKVYHLLARFNFIGEQKLDKIRHDIDSLLLALVDRREQLADKRGALLEELLNSAASGDATVATDSLLAKFDLAAVPLTKWGELQARSQREFKRALELRHYDPALDVRTAAGRELAQRWSAAGPAILALSGESGQGKTWLLYALGLALLDEGQVVVVVEATGSARDDLQQAANIFWQRMKNHDSSIPLNGIAARRRELLHKHSEQWLVILLDGLKNGDEAETLTREPLENWGIKLATTGVPEVVEILERAAGKRMRVERISSFNTAERDNYLERRLGDSWITIPADVRDTLCNPLLASIYCNMSDPTMGWNPTNEYELYEKFWRRLYAELTDEPALSGLALSVLQERPYPWPPSILYNIGMNEETVARLIRIGWLRRALKNHFEIPHDRLLNFAVAHALAAELREGKRNTASVAPLLREMLISNPKYSGRRLQYVPMDVLYVLVSNEDGARLATELIASIDSEDGFDLRKTLYSDLLPTLGERVIAVLFARLASVADHWQPYMLKHIMEGITAFDTQETRARAMGLLESGSPRQKRAAVYILSKCPDARALDQLWQVHRDMQKDPSAYGADSKTWWLLYEDSFPALRECARLDPAWVERKIREAIPGEHRIEDLGYVVAHLNDGGATWRRCKRDLIAKVPSNKLRSLVTNIDRYQDIEEIDVLLQLIPRKEDSAGAAAVRALARIDPDLAIDQLLNLVEPELVLARGWFMPWLLQARGHETCRRLLEHMRQLPDPWPFVLVYQGFENELDSATVDLLLDASQRRLRQAREIPPPANQRAIYQPLSMLAEIHAPALLESFKARRDTALEEDLVVFLLQLGPRSDLSPDSLEREPALSILSKIGGTGLTRVIKAYLQGPSRYGRCDAIALATKADDDCTRDLLLERGLQEELWDGYPLEQSEAAQALATLGDVKRLIQVVIRLGLAMSLDLDECIAAARPFDDESMAPAFAILRDRAATEEQRVGAILGVGLGRRSDWLQQILALMFDADPASPLALAGVVAVGLLKSGDEPAIEFLRNQLEVENHRHAVRIALWNIRSEAAIDVLLEYAIRREDAEIAALLTQHERTHSRALDFVRSKLPSLLGGTGSLEAYNVICRLDDDSLRRVMQEEPIRDGIRAIAIGDLRTGWVSGLRCAAIRALALIEPNTAFLACRSAVESTNETDREAYPHLMLQIDGQRAVVDLFERCPRERSTWMAHVIARALAQHDVQKRTEVALASADPRSRRAACIIASHCPPGTGIHSLLRGALDDPDRDVAEAALDTLRKLRTAQKVDQLVRAYEAETDDRRRWVFADALVELGDPGDAGNGWPAWSVRVVENGPRAIGRYLASRINEARKKAKERADREDRDRSR